MKISQKYNLNKHQYELDFVDIDISEELPLFLDAYVFSLKDDPWSKKCDEIISDFFRNIREAVECDDKTKLKKLCANLTEPNETCLGRSKGAPRGIFKSTDSMVEIFEQLFEIKKKDKSQFDAINALSDMKFYIEGVGNDTISDIVTTLIRRQLLIYTKEQCDLYGIPTKKIVSKPFWNEVLSRWEKEESIEQLIIEGNRILLAPKNIVFAEKYYTFSKDRFVQHDMLNHLKAVELQTPNSELIQYRVPKKGQKVGEPFVTKKSIRERNQVDRKQNLLNFSSKYPKIMNDFKNKNHFKSLNVIELSEISNEEITDINYNSLIDDFINTLKSIPKGNMHANEYHEFIMGLLTFVFHPSLCNPKKETPIDNTRKRIDITYINTADQGFFSNLKSEITSNYIYVECKNYSEKISNPEFDQLSGRFNESASKVGLLVCRECDELAFERVSGQYRRKGELILIITDDLLINILRDMKISDVNSDISLLRHEKYLFDLKRKIEVENF